MSLNNSHMLPERVRSMRQMREVLSAEDIILGEIEQIITEMYQRASMLHEELVNEAWLERRLSDRTGAEVKVTGHADRLLVEFVFQVNEFTVIDLKDIRRFLNKWLPAHLQYQLNDRLVTSLQNALPVVRLISVHTQLKIPYLPYRAYDGTAFYNGASKFDAKRSYKMGMGMELCFRVSAPEEDVANLTVETRRNVSYYDGRKLHYDGMTLYNAMIRKDTIE